MLSWLAFTSSCSFNYLNKPPKLEELALRDSIQTSSSIEINEQDFPKSKDSTHVYQIQKKLNGTFISRENLENIPKELKTDNYDLNLQPRTIQNKKVILQKYKEYRKETALNDLILELKNEGYDITEYINDDRFMIDENIIKYYKKSPEKIAHQSVEKKEKTWIDSYQDYSKRLGIDIRKQKSIEFIQKYSADLIKAEEEHNIPKEIIVATIGIETNFGSYFGGWRAFNALISTIIMNNVEYKEMLSENYANSMNNHFKSLVKLGKEQNFNVFSPSSFAGAIGIPQFMPLSIEDYVKNEDLFNMTDVIYLIAEYYDDRRSKTSIFNTIKRYNYSNSYMLAICDMADFVNTQSGWNPNSDYFTHAIDWLKAQNE